MKDFSGKLAVVTGGGDGMGRALARQLVAEGCDVAMCDVMEENMAETRRLCEQEASQGRVVTTHPCDVSDEEAVIEFANAVRREHKTDHIDLLFNNAGVGGVTSFVDGDRDVWERTFNICWYGVYYCARAFMPMLFASKDAHMVNTSSVNGFWATTGPRSTHSSYSAAKFAVKGFTEALMTDFRNNAPHVKVSVVMPGHIGTSIALNSGQIIRGRFIDELSAEGLRSARMRLQLPEDTPDDDVKQALRARGERFRDNAPTTAEQAARIILDGVREERWRILVGDDAHALDDLVREDPENAYTEEFLEKLRTTVPWALS